MIKYIIEDTRQKIGKHKLKEDFFKLNGINIVRSKLPVGDFARLDDLTTIIDTKKNVLELVNNICGKQHERFRKECQLAQFCGIKLIFLIEEDYTFETLKNWTSKRTQVKGETLVKAMLTMQERYGIEFVFCDKEDAGKKIIEILIKY